MKLGMNFANNDPNKFLDYSQEIAAFHAKWYPLYN